MAAPHKGATETTPQQMRVCTRAQTITMHTRAGDAYCGSPYSSSTDHHIYQLTCSCRVVVLGATLMRCIQDHIPTDACLDHVQLPVLLTSLLHLVRFHLWVLVGLRMGLGWLLAKQYWVQEAACWVEGILGLEGVLEVHSHQSRGPPASTTLQAHVWTMCRAGTFADIPDSPCHLPRLWGPIGGRWGPVGRGGLRVGCRGLGGVPELYGGEGGWRRLLAWREECVLGTRFASRVNALHMVVGSGMVALLVS